MKSVEQIIKERRLIEKGKVIGVAVSGGMDSMSLLYFLNANKAKYGIDLFVINIDHEIRQEGYKDSQFVKKYCEENNIKHKLFKVNVPRLKEDMGWTTEQAAREARIEVFHDLLKTNKVDKIFLGHHESDQVETILLNLFRGTGLDGVTGMKVISGDFVRPMLNTRKKDIQQYVFEKKIPYVTDESNEDNQFSRNYLRNILIPLIKKRWESFEDNLLSFSKIAETDNNYIRSQSPKELISKDEFSVKIPTAYFAYEEPVVNRMIKGALSHIQASKDIEHKHLKMITNMVHNLKNGAKLNLPAGIDVYKEYDYITIVSKHKKYHFEPFKLRSGKYKIRGFGEMEIRRTYEPEKMPGDHIVDIRKAPPQSVWRTKIDGDTFQKLGAGTKKLKDYMIDKKIPQRLRDKIPVLAYKNEIYIVAGHDISEKVKIDSTSKSGYFIKYKTD